MRMRRRGKDKQVNELKEKEREGRKMKDRKEERKIKEENFAINDEKEKRRRPGK